MLIQKITKMQTIIRYSLSNINRGKKHTLVIACLFLFSGCSQIMDGKTMKSMNEIYPLDFDLKEAEEKGIGKKEEYLKVQSHYLKYLSSYLNSIYDFQEVDKILNENSFEITKEKPYYLSISELGSNYVYLRNNVHCERLTNDQISFLKKDIKNSNDEEGIELVKSTYKEVLSVESEDFDEDFQLSYTQGNNKESIVENTSLVFYINFDVVEFSKENVDAYVELKEKNKLILKSISDEISNTLSERLGTKVYVFNADDQLMK